MDSSPSQIRIPHLPNGCEEDDLYNMFGPFGPILSVEILPDNKPPETPESAGIVPSFARSASVEFASTGSAWNAYWRMNGIEIFGQTLRVISPQTAMSADIYALQSSDHAPRVMPHVQPRSWVPKYSASPMAPLSEDLERALTAVGIKLPPFQAVLRKGGLRPASSQLLVSFKVQQGFEVVDGNLLRDLFNCVGTSVDVQLKHNEFDGTHGVQHGYGFVLFGKSWNGIMYALIASFLIKGRSFAGIAVDCNLAHQLVTFLTFLRGEFGIDLLTAFSPHGSAADIISFHLAEGERRLQAMGFSHGAAARPVSAAATIYANHAMDRNWPASLGRHVADRDRYATEMSRMMAGPAHRFVHAGPGDGYGGYPAQHGHLGYGQGSYGPGAMSMAPRDEYAWASSREMSGHSRSSGFAPLQRQSPLLAWQTDAEYMDGPPPVRWGGGGDMGGGTIRWTDSLSQSSGSREGLVPDALLPQVPSMRHNALWRASSPGSSSLSQEEGSGDSQVLTSGSCVWEPPILSGSGLPGIAGDRSTWSPWPDQRQEPPSFNTNEQPLRL